MANGKLASYDLNVAGAVQSVYQVGTDRYSVVTLNLCNRSNETTVINVAITDTESSQDASRYIEYDTQLPRKGILERTGIVMQPGQYITVRSSVAGVSATVYGVETGALESLTPITEVTTATFQPPVPSIVFEDPHNPQSEGGGEEEVLPPAPAPIGEAIFTSTGSTNWTVPDGVSTVSVVAVGGGGGGSFNEQGTGGGGGLAWANNVSVTPGSTISVTVGTGGNGASSDGNSANNGGNSSFGSIFTALGGLGAQGGAQDTNRGATGSFDGGGSGGAGIGGSLSDTGRSQGGGGAAGYTGNGGRGGSTADRSATAGSGGGGGGGYADGENFDSGGGGVGIFGQGSNGPAGTTSQGGQGGSGGSNGILINNDSGKPNGGTYGGGGGTNDSNSGDGAQGAVRVIWGDGRSFPTTNVDQASSEGNVTTY